MHKITSSKRITRYHQGKTNKELIHYLVSMGRSLWDASLNGTEGGMKQWTWMDNPKPGDLVIETSHSETIKAIGHLISANFEPCYSDEEWEEIKDQWDNEERPTEKIWRIRLLLDGTECRWENAHFVRLSEIYSDFSSITRGF